MNNTELLEKMKKIKINLENCRSKLKSAQNILDESITFDKEGFKTNEIDLLKTKLSTQINNLNNKIIPEVEIM